MRAPFNVAMQIKPLLIALQSEHVKDNQEVVTGLHDIICKIESDYITEVVTESRNGWHDFTAQFSNDESENWTVAKYAKLCFPKKTTIQFIGLTDVGLVTTFHYDTVSKIIYHFVLNNNGVDEIVLPTKTIVKWHEMPKRPIARSDMLSPKELLIIRLNFDEIKNLWKNRVKELYTKLILNDGKSIEDIESVANIIIEYTKAFTNDAKKLLLQKGFDAIPDNLFGEFFITNVKDHILWVRKDKFNIAVDRFYTIPWETMDSTGYFHPSH
jgi:hypothetical protein